jgi:hypothetical protein
MLFPVINSLEVRGFPMYPGTDPANPGFQKKLEHGVTIVVGINGIGKTTLLNLLRFMLLGPRQPKKADILKPGTKTHALVWTKDFDYFSVRARRNIADAFAAVVVSLGKERIYIKRRLDSLELLELRHNDRILEGADEGRYEELVVELSGVRDGYDFDFVVRHLMFFLEQKVPLLWSPEGQFEILRILFLPKDLSDQCARLADQIKVADSLYRNRLWQLRPKQDRLKEMETAYEELLPKQQSLKQLETEADSLKESLDVLATDIEKCSTRLEKAEAQRLKVQVRSYELRQTLRELEQTELALRFPDMPATARLVFGTLLAGQGCLVCGTKTADAVNRFRTSLLQHTCPVCQTPDSLAARNASGKRGTQKINALQKEIDELDAEEGQLARDVGRFEEDFKQFFQEKAKQEVRKAALDRSLQAVGKGNSEIDQLRDEIRQYEETLKKEQRGLAARRKEYNALLEEARSEIASVAKDIVRTFRRYTARFFLERCSLRYDLHKRTLGESGVLLQFPQFVVEMSSATSQVASDRSGADEVSESQKEYLDLAFRMSLMKAAARKGSGGTLVIETPEASLDTFFIDRAGRMLRDFAHTGTRGGGSIVVTSNLNNENMIPALLGGKLGREQVDAKVLNLLEIAAKPPALKTKWGTFRAAYRRAIGHA